MIGPAFVDRLTQQWVRVTGKRVRLAEHRWLDGPVGDSQVIGAEWIDREARRHGAVINPGGGLIHPFTSLAGPGFDPSLLNTAVTDFYERTDQWRLEAWSQWTALAWPFGWMLSALFARRLRQLSLPLRPLDVAHGMDSSVLTAVVPDGRNVGAAWLRTLRATGQTVYSGWYGLVTLPGAGRPSIRVVFPLPNGSLMIFLRPDVAVGGALSLVSPLGSMGDDGAYLVVVDGGGTEAFVRRVPLREKFLVYVDDEGVLRSNHSVDLWRFRVIRFHYRLERKLEDVA